MHLDVNLTQLKKKEQQLLCDFAFLQSSLLMLVRFQTEDSPHELVSVSLCTSEFSMAVIPPTESIFPMIMSA